MKLEHLRYIKEVADAGSMCAAAEKLFVTQQNISKVIRQVESAFNIQIFLRSRKGIVLTEDGQKFYEWINKQLYLYQETIGQIKTIQRERMTGELSIITMSGGMIMVVPNLIGDYYDKFPNVELKFTEATLMEAISAVEKGEADFGIVLQLNILHESQNKFSNDIDVVPLLDGQYCYWVSTTSVYAERGYITLEEVIQEPLLVYKNTDFQLLNQYFEAHRMGGDFQIRAESSNLHVFEPLIANGQGILPDIAFSDYQSMYSDSIGRNREVTAVPLKDKNSGVSIVLITSKSSEKTALVKMTLDYLKVVAKGELLL